MKIVDPIDYDKIEREIQFNIIDPDDELAEYLLWLLSDEDDDTISEVMERTRGNAQRTNQRTSRSFGKSPEGF